MSRYFVHTPPSEGEVWVVDREDRRFAPFDTSCWVNVDGDLINGIEAEHYAWVDIDDPNEEYSDDLKQLFDAALKTARGEA